MRFTEIAPRISGFSVPVFGVHVAMLAAKHGLDVEDELAAIIPDAPEES